MKDLDEIGGLPVIMKDLLDHGLLYGDCMTVTGKTIAENLELINLQQIHDADKKVPELSNFVVETSFNH